MGSDTASDTVEPVIVFRYPPAFLVLMVLGIPIAVVFSISFPCVALYLLTRPAGLSIAVKLDAIVVGGLGLAAGWIVFSFLRTWYAPFTVYEVDQRGIKSRFLGSESFLAWRELKTARYRKSLGQIDIHFNGATRTVVLSNVDLNPDRRRVCAALQLIEKMAPDRIRGTWL